MKAVQCVALKNNIQDEMTREYAALPRGEWVRRQMEALAKSRQPVAEFWRRSMPARRPWAAQVAEATTDYRVNGK